MGATERYDLTEAKAWAQENFEGVCNVLIPSFTQDLCAINERAVRHDVERNIELGFWGALLVSELSMSRRELRQFMEAAVDAGGGRHYTVLHGSFDTVEDLIDRSRDARAIGVDALLLSYPNSFYPRTPAELSQYVRTVAEGCELAVILFSAPHFNLERLDRRGYPLECMLELAAIPNVVAIKHEVGQPGVVGSYEVFRRLADSGAIVTDPFEPNALLWADLFGTKWIGTSNYEYLGASVPKMMQLAQAGELDRALEIYWRVQPARQVRARLTASFAGANFNHRYFWKFQAWLQGYNGGPLRAPVMKLTDSLMAAAVQGVLDAGLIDSVPADLGEFFAGRCPE